MPFAGFDIPKIRGLGSDVKALGDRAGALHNDISGVLFQAQALLGGKPATTSPALQPLVRPPVFWVGLFGGAQLPGALGRELHDMSDSITRRCNQLEKCSALLDKGYAIDPAVVFADEKAPDQQKIDGALSAVAALNGKGFGEDGNRDDLEKVKQQLDGLTAAELDAFLAKVPPEDLKRYGDLAGKTDDSGMWWWESHDGIPDNEFRDHLSGLLRKAGPAHWGVLESAFPGIQPGFDTTDVYLDGANSQRGVNTSGITYQTPTLPLFAHPGKVDASTISQGQFADCWYIASLTATAQANPQFIAEGIKKNANGTVDVRIWDKDGTKHWVTVTPDLPTDANGNPVSAHGNGETWPAYYEKAFALTYGGDQGGTNGHDGDPRYDKAEKGDYGATEWDQTDKAPPYVTGHDSSSIDNNLDAIRKSFESHHPVIVATGTEQPPQNGPSDLSQGFVTRHVYYVKGFTSDGRIRLGNPWGSGNPDVLATPEEYEKYFNSPQQLRVGE
ncbi:C2 family cysteine protease [Streptomyces sp. NPDC048664]|uniref:C2 family cysteine protease n=1 Tax=Streptomyces sp. NPDC048664 TaxID=3154505 RepID=UPI0034158377